MDDVSWSSEAILGQSTDPIARPSANRVRGTPLEMDWRRQIDCFSIHQLEKVVHYIDAESLWRDRAMVVIAVVRVHSMHIPVVRKVS